MDNIFNEGIRVIKCRDKEMNGRRKGSEGGIRRGKELGGRRIIFLRRDYFSCYGREPRGARRLVCSD
jgi:hypothetical protein